MPKAGIAALLLGLVAALGGEPASAGERAICEYDVAFGNPTVTLDVQVRCDAAGIRGFEMPAHGAAAWIKSFALADGRALDAANGGWRLPADLPTPFQLRYRLDLAGLARANQDYDIAMRAGDAILVDPSAWLALPEIDGDPMLDIRFHPAGGAQVATAMPETDGVYRFHTGEMRSAGSTVFGRFERRRIELPGPGAMRPSAAAAENRAVIDLAIMGDPMTASPDALAAWVHDTALVDAGFWKGFPTPHALVILVPSEGKTGLGFGRVLNGAGCTMMIVVGANTAPRALYDEWVLVHEMLHLGTPFMRDTGAWLNEGIATYVEPIVRFRAGWKTEDEIWREWIENMPRGLDAMGPGGLAAARGGEVYWGGALYLLLADVAIRERTKGERGIEDGLIALLDGGGDVMAGGETLPALAIADRGIGGTTMSDLARRYLQPGGAAIDLDGLWQRLGVRLAGDGGITYDDTAPLAWVRKAIVHGGPASGPGPIAVSLP
jgi:hypothetical protein